MGTTFNDGIFFKYSWRKALMGYPAEVRFEVYEAIMEYAESGTLIELKPMAKIAFSIFKVEIDIDKERRKAISAKRADAGRKAMEVRYNKPQQEVTNLTSASKCYQELEKNPPIYNNILNNNLDNIERKEDISKDISKKRKKTAVIDYSVDIEERKKAFYDTIKPFVGKYPKDMLRSFFDYWSEMNQKRTKMRYEIELETRKTWEISKRLARWANNNKGSFGSSTEIGTVLHDNGTEKYENESKWER